MNETIGFIGLGTLGQPIAHNLLKAGYLLKIYNRTASKAEPFKALGAEIASRPAETLTPGGMIVTVVSNDEALEEVVMSEGFLTRLGAGGIHLSMSTVSPALARSLATLHTQHGSFYVEAPVFGRPEAAAAQLLWICTAGPIEAKARVRPLLEAMGQGIFDFGEEIGAALTVKLCGNFLGSAATRAMREALAMVKKSGGDPTKVIDMLTQTLFSAPIYQSYGKTIALDPEHFSQGALSWIPLKDLGLFQEAARQVGSQTALAHFLYEEKRQESLTETQS
jgi:3-hydroxyisobutyrate dehydrogenase-like beta-hydroxyacid dehydrogenase